MKTSAFLVLFVFPFFVFSQVLSGLVEYKDLGVSFTIPNDWVGQEQEGVVLLGSNTIPGIMLLTANEATNVEQMKALAREGLNEDGVSLQIIGDIYAMNRSLIDPTSHLLSA